MSCSRRSTRSGVPPGSGLVSAPASERSRHPGGAVRSARMTRNSSMTLVSSESTSSSCRAEPIIVFWCRRLGRRFPGRTAHASPWALISFRRCWTKARYCSTTSSALADRHQLSPVEPRGPVAELRQLADRMAHEDDAARLAQQLVHRGHALLLEALVSDGQDLIEEEDLRIEMHRYGKGQSREHPRRVGLHRPVDGLTQLGVLDDLVVTLVDLLLGQTRPRDHRGRCCGSRRARR